MNKEEIKLLRTTLKLTQQELAVRLCVTVGSVNKWEKGKCEPSRLAMQKILALKHEAEHE